MRTTMDAAGRLVIPKSIRDEAGLIPGAPLEVHLLDGRVEIEPVSVPITLVREGHLLVAKAEIDVPPLTAETVEQIRRRVRCDHDA